MNHIPPSRRSLAEARRVVIKLGTQVVTLDGVELAEVRLAALVREMAVLRRDGREIVLVSSGAVGLGVRALGLPERPASLGMRQACAAAGQGALMSVYARAFGREGLVAAQVLLTQDDLADRDRALCVRTTLMRLLELGAIPVLNENDSVSVRELVEYRRARGGDASAVAFGDNDGLSARVAVALDADALILLTNVAGLHAADPTRDPHAPLVSELDAAEAPDAAAPGEASAGGSGGMASKLDAARLAAGEGIAVAIAHGAEPDVLARLLAGEPVGTLVRPAGRRGARLRRIAVGAGRRGALIVNDGALAALADRKASLLPIGVVGVEGEFEKGDVVEIRDGSGRVHGRGLVNYAARACRLLAGRRSEEADTLITPDERGYDAVVTRDNLVMGNL